MIQLIEITKVYNQGRPNELWALRGIDLSLEANRIAVIQGPSGSGKTSLLSIIGCLSRPTSGRVLLHGKLLSGLPERFLTQVRRHTFGFIFQQFHLIRGIRLVENLMLPAYPLGPDYAGLKAKARGLLERFGLAGKEDSPVEWLSGGEQERAAICRALINDPEILIADEPTANLDGRLTAEFMGLVADLKAEGKTLILSSHDPRVAQHQAVDRVIRMGDGLLVED